MSSSGVVYYISPGLSAIKVRHAFSTRLGGISPRPFDSLNLGNPSGCAIQDDYARIWSNYAKLLKAIGCPGDPPLRVHQVHGDSVAEAERDSAFDTSCQADAIVSSDSNRAISIRTADCIPILVSTGDGRTVAAIHAGWRGIVAGVIPAAIKRIALRASGAKPEEMIAAIGPCIGPDAFEIGPEVLSEFERVFGSDAPIRRSSNGKGHADLSAAARLQLLAYGLESGNIDTTDQCTWSNREEFFSHRRDNGITGRMAAIISPNTGGFTS